MSTPAIQTIRSLRGRFASVIYKNAKGETKRYIVRTGVRKYVSGHGIKPQTKEPSTTVYSVTSGNTGYKTFVESGILQVTSGKTVFCRT